MSTRQKEKKNQHTYEMVTIAKWIWRRYNLSSDSGMKIPQRALSLALLQGLQVELKSQTLLTPESVNNTC